MICYTCVLAIFCGNGSAYIVPVYVFFVTTGILFELCLSYVREVCYVLIALPYCSLRSALSAATLFIIGGIALLHTSDQPLSHNTQYSVCIWLW